MLAGLISGLMAQGTAPYDAACMHGKAAMNFGTRLIAEDISSFIPEITRSIIKCHTWSLELRS